MILWIIVLLTLSFVTYINIPKQKIIVNTLHIVDVILLASLAITPITKSKAENISNTFDSLSYNKLITFESVFFFSNLIVFN